ncbi:MAG: aminopeptidase [Deltaproteobacteria bacterium]|nr:aminopeptidase [Deltaproteobacteria bacterium]
MKVLLLLFLTGCLYTQFVAQAARGQLEIMGRARPIEEVVRDPETPLRTAMLLAEIPAIREYGKSYGLTITRNYKKYSDLGERRPAAVWFVGGADPLQFRPVPWCFPIAGCFPGLGWFDEDDAVAFKLQLDAQGLDAVVRPAGAFSTGGWFPDPVVSTMLGGGDSALPELANVILHESVHATAFVQDEQFFNESFANYVADALTENWVEQRFGPGSPEEVSWRLGQALNLPRVARQLATYKALKAVYEDKTLTKAQKLARKAAIIDELMTDLHLRKRPNNATINEVRLYNGGAEALRKAHRACGDLRSLVLAGKRLRRDDFTKNTQEDLAPIGERLAQLCAQKLDR